MAMIMDAIARHGVWGAIRSLLSPKNMTSDHAETPVPQYVYARKRYESGRKGRICVYRISDKRTNRDGRRVRLYTNVEGVNLDEDERQTFTGIEHIRNYDMGRSTRQKKRRTPPALDKVIKSKIELQVLDVKPYDLSDGSFDRRFKSDGMAPSQAKGSGSSSNKESGVPQPVDSRRRSRRKPRRDPHRAVGVVERRRPPSRTLGRRKASCFDNRMSRERPIEDELGVYCSGALPIPQHQPDGLSLEPAPAEPLRSFRKTTIDGTIKLVNDVGNDSSGAAEHHQVGRKQTESVVLEEPGSPFRQPGLTPQESSDLVFGTGSKVDSRRKLQAGRMDDRIAPDVHEFVSQIEHDDPLGEAEQMTEACSPSRKPCALGLEHTSFGVREAENPLVSRAQILVGPSRTATSTRTSRMNLPASASPPQYADQSHPLESSSRGGILYGATQAQESRFLLNQPLQQASAGGPGSVHAQAGAPCNRFLSTTIPGTPPYTPEKDESSQK